MEDFIIEKDVLVKYSGTQQKVVIPEGVTKINEGAFQNKTFSNIILPSTLKKIGANAFNSCARLSCINIPEGIVSIEHNTFYGCLNLKEIQLPNTLQKIGRGAFAGCASLTKIVIPDGCEKIGADCFAKCINLKDIYVPYSVSSIGKNALEAYYKSTVIHAPKGSFTESYTIANRLSLDYQKAPRTTENQNTCEFFEVTSEFEIDESGCLVKYNGAKKEVIIPNNIKEIGAGAFAKNQNIVSVVVPETVETIGYKAFAYCENLRKISLTSTINRIGASAFVFCSSLEEVIIPEGVTAIESWSFSECKGLKTVVLPNTLLKIEERAFQACMGLEKIVIPEGCEELEQCSIIACLNLKDVYLPSSLNKIGISNIYAFNKDTVFHAPQGSFAESFVKAKHLKFERMDAPNEEKIPFSSEDNNLERKTPENNVNIGSLSDETIETNINVKIEKLRQEVDAKDKLISATMEKKKIFQTALDNYIKAIPSEFAEIERYQTEIAEIEKEYTEQNKSLLNKSSELNGLVEQKEEYIKSLVIQREKCFFLAITKKKELDALILTKRSELRTLVDEQECLGRDIHSEKISYAQKLKPLQQKLQELQNTKNRWEADRNAQQKAINRIEDELQSCIEEITSLKTELAQVEKALEEAKERAKEKQLQKELKQKEQEEALRLKKEKELEEAAEREKQILFQKQDSAEKVKSIQESVENEAGNNENFVLAESIDALKNQLEVAQTSTKKFENHLEQKAKREQKEAEEQVQRKAEALAKGKSETDIINMYVILTNEVKLGKLNRSNEEFYETYADDFAAMSKEEIINTRKNILEAMDDGELCAHFAQIFGQRTVEKRYSVSTRNLYALSEDPEMQNNADWAVENTKEWYQENEYAQVRQLMDNDLKLLREDIDEQLSQVDDKWIEFDTAKEFLQIVVKKFDESAIIPEASNFQIISNSNLIEVTISTKGFFSMSTVINNYYTWYWGVDVRTIWENAFENKIKDERENECDGVLIANQAIAQIKSKCLISETKRDLFSTQTEEQNIVKDINETFEKNVFEDAEIFVDEKDTENEIANAEIIDDSSCDKETATARVSNKNIPEGVIYPPGEEPEKIRQRLDNLFAKLDAAYPNKEIIINDLRKNHDSWNDTIVSLYRVLGYPDKDTFFEAYGYSFVREKGGGIASDPMIVINELKRRYVDGPKCKTVDELRADNPDIAVKFKNLQNNANKFFGMSFIKYLIEQGILVGKTEKQYAELIDTLKLRYSNNPFGGTLQELQKENPDINLEELRNHLRAKVDVSFKEFLTNEGVLLKQPNTIEARLDSVTEELKKRYSKAEVQPKTLDIIKKDNPDLMISSVNAWTRQLYNISAREYFAQHGIMSIDTSEEELLKVTQILKERYKNKKIYTIQEMQNENPDLPIDKIGTWAKKVFGQSASAYLANQEILSEDDWNVWQAINKMRREFFKKVTEERMQKDLNNNNVPIYEPPIYYVDEIDVSEEEAIKWEYEKTSENDDELLIKDYLGDENHIVVPSSINGKKVVGFGWSAFEGCKASTVEIPGTIKRIQAFFGKYNSNIRTIVIGEGVEFIESYCCVDAENLSEVKISKSVIGIGEMVFNNTPWYNAQKDFVIIGSTLAKVKNEKKVLMVPYGIKSIGNNVTGYNLTTEVVVLPETVTTLQEAAFDDCDGVRNFVFTESLVNIEKDAFGYNDWIKKFGAKPLVVNGLLYRYYSNAGTLAIPEGVTKIGAEVFKNNQNLKRITLPKTLKCIGKSAFEYCENLESISLPEGLECIEENSFANCKKLSQITIPDSVVKIEKNAFANCISLTEIILGKNIEIIGDGAFSKCKKLKVMQLGDNLKTIGESVFEGCISLKRISVPRGVRRISADAFKGCGELAFIELHGEVEYIGEAAFSGCRNITEFKSFKWTGAPKKIADDCFAGCSSLTIIPIPDSIEYIGDNAFFKCRSLQNIKLPARLNTIGENAFYGCSRITNIVVPNTVNTIGDSAFENCESLAEISLPKTIPNLGADVFTNTPYMKNKFGDFVILNGVLLKYQGEGKDVIIPEGVNVVGKYSFENAWHVESITIPDSVELIDECVMGISFGDDCPQLQKLVIGNSVKCIGDKAFQNCRQLSEIAFGEGLTEMGKCAFSECAKLKKVDISKTSIIKIGDSAFWNCSELKSLKLSNCLEVIEGYAFVDVNAKKVVLPKTVKTIGKSSFYGTQELIIYDTIDPDAMDANQWVQQKGLYSENYIGMMNSKLACAPLYIGPSVMEGACNTRWNSYHITVLSSETDEIKYRIFCDGEENRQYLDLMYSAWGKNASFTFDLYDGYFMKLKSRKTKAETAFCRIQYPGGLSEKHRDIYETFLSDCMYIKGSAEEISSMIAENDSVERLEILNHYNAINERNIGWIRKIMNTKKAKKCIEFLENNFSNKEG